MPCLLKTRHFFGVIKMSEFVDSLVAERAAAVAKSITDNNARIIANKADILQAKADMQAMSEQAKSLAFQKLDAGYSVQVEVIDTFSIVTIDDNLGHAYVKTFNKEGQLVKSLMKPSPFIK
jgi:hypothetical protein